LPELKIRVVNVVDLMRLQPDTEHPHGLRDPDFDSLFTQDKPIIFAFHGYPWLIHRLAYRRRNHVNCMCAATRRRAHHDPLRYDGSERYGPLHLVEDVINRLPQLAGRGDYLKDEMQNRLIEHRQYITRYGEDMPLVRGLALARRPGPGPVRR